MTRARRARSKQCSPAQAATSAPKPPVSTSSCTTSRRWVVATDSATMLVVPRRDRAQVDDLDLDAVGLGQPGRGLQRLLDRRPPRDDGEVVARRVARSPGRTARRGRGRGRGRRCRAGAAGACARGTAPGPRSGTRSAADRPRPRPGTGRRSAARARGRRCSRRSGCARSTRRSGSRRSAPARPSDR